MSKSNHSKFILFFLALSIYLTACKIGDNQPSITFGSGVYILNQGQYPNGAGDVSFYNRTNGTFVNDLYSASNGYKLGNVVQSMLSYYNTNFIIVNNANKIYTVDPKTFAFKGNVIVDATLPRYALGIDTGRIYISSWGKGSGDSSLLVFKPSTFRVTTKINTGNGPDRMLQNGSVLYVVNSGGLSKDSTVAVVSLQGDSVVYKINVAIGPNSIVLDANSDLWVLSGGYYDRPEKGKLQRIRGGKVDLSFDAPQYADHLCTDPTANVLYYTAGNTVYSKDIVNFGANPPKAFFTASYLSYGINGLGVDPTSGYMFINDAKDFTRAGTSYIIDLSAKTLKDSLKVGVAPGELYFIK